MILREQSNRTRRLCRVPLAAPVYGSAWVMLYDSMETLERLAKRTILATKTKQKVNALYRPDMTSILTKIPTFVCGPNTVWQVFTCPWADMIMRSACTIGRLVIIRVYITRIP